MTDTERLDFIAKQRIEIRFSDVLDKFIVGTYEERGGFFHWGKSADLRTALDDAIREIRGLSNGN